VIEGLSIILAASILALPLFALVHEIRHSRRFIVASLADLTASVDKLDASVTALTAAGGTAVDFAPLIARIDADRAAIDAVTTNLGGTPPGP
jgi:hypothetical protein